MKDQVHFINQHHSMSVLHTLLFFITFAKVRMAVFQMLPAITGLYHHQKYICISEM